MSNILKSITIFLIKTYQYLISPLLPSSCKFYPTCSSYAIHTLQKHSFIKALYHIIVRIIKCNPLTYGGYDPIKESNKCLISKD